MNLPLVVSRNGELISSESACFSPLNPACINAFGVYETVQVAEEVAFHLPDHLRRMASSARQIEMELPATPETMADWVLPLLKANGAKNCILKFLALGSSAGYGPVCFAWPEAMPHYPERYYTDGVDAITVSMERTMPTAKTLNTLANFLARRRAQRAGTHESLLIDRAGRVTEGSNSNFFAFSADSLLTAPAAAILSGVTRDLTLHLAQRTGIPIYERDLPLSDRNTWDEAFITSTSRHIMPLTMLDSRPIGQGQVGPMTRRLKDAFEDYFRTAIAASKIPPCP